MPKKLFPFPSAPNLTIPNTVELGIREEFDELMEVMMTPEEYFKEGRMAEQEKPQMCWVMVWDYFDEDESPPIAVFTNEDEARQLVDDINAFNSDTYCSDVRLREIPLNPSRVWLPGSWMVVVTEDGKVKRHSKLSTVLAAEAPKRQSVRYREPFAGPMMGTLLPFTKPPLAEHMEFTAYGLTFSDARAAALAERDLWAAEQTSEEV